MRQKSPRLKVEQVRYAPGDAFAVPFPDGGYGVATAFRFGVDKRIPRRIATAGFDRVYESVPTCEQIAELTIHDVVLYLVCSDLAIGEKRWPICGKIRDFSADRWILPPETVVLFKGESRPTDPNEQIIWITSEDLVSNTRYCNSDNIINPKDYEYLPTMLGLGDARSLEPHLEQAVICKNPRSRLRWSPKALRVWHQIYKRIKDPDVKTSE